MAARFGDKTAIVTGGGSGIGRAVALALAREGASVMVAGRSSDTLDETVVIGRGEGLRVTACLADVSRRTDVERLLERAVAEYGRLDVAVNSAGIARMGLLIDLDSADWSDLVSVNLTGAWNCLRQEVSYLRENGGGTIVSIASNVGAHSSMNVIGAYGAVKAGVAALTRAAALAHIGDGVRINTVSPGPVATDLSRAPGQSDEERDAMYEQMIPRGKIGSPEEVADAVLWLASDEAAYVVGHDLVIDGGVSI